MKKLIEKLGEMKRMHAELCRCSRQSFPYTNLIRMTIDTTKKKKQSSAVSVINDWNRKAGE